MLFYVPYHISGFWGEEKEMGKEYIYSLPLFCF